MKDLTFIYAEFCIIGRIYTYGNEHYIITIVYGRHVRPFHHVSNQFMLCSDRTLTVPYRKPLKSVVHILQCYTLPKKLLLLVVGGGGCLCSLYYGHALRLSPGIPLNTNQPQRTAVFQHISLACIFPNVHECAYH